MDADTITFLLRGGHLNMEDRQEKGIWPHPPLKYSEILDHLVRIVEQQRWFPCDLSECREGVVIENVDGRFICHSLTFAASGELAGGGRKQTVFSNAVDATEFYLKWDLHLPGDLDGWEVI